ncbi:MAG: hypothetical protein ACR2O4_10100 [Hyphomicrobiaceae bacterium]
MFVVEAPGVLGTLRGEIAERVEPKTHATVAKDLTAIPTDKIADILSDTIAL